MRSPSWREYGEHTKRPPRDAAQLRTRSCPRRDRARVSEGELCARHRTFRRSEATEIRLRNRALFPAGLESCLPSGRHATSLAPPIACHVFRGRPSGGHVRSRRRQPCAGRPEKLREPTPSRPTRCHRRAISSRLARAARAGPARERWPPMGRALNGTWSKSSRQRTRPRGAVHVAAHRSSAKRAARSRLEARPLWPTERS